MLAVLLSWQIKLLGLKKKSYSRSRNGRMVFRANKLELIYSTSWWCSQYLQKIRWSWAEQGAYAGGGYWEGDLYVIIHTSLPGSAWYLCSIQCHQSMVTRERSSITVRPSILKNRKEMIYIHSAQIIGWGQVLGLVCCVLVISVVLSY